MRRTPVKTERQELVHTVASSPSASTTTSSSASSSTSPLSSSSTSTSTSTSRSSSAASTKTSSTTSASSASTTTTTSTAPAPVATPPRTLRGTDTRNEVEAALQVMRAVEPRPRRVRRRLPRHATPKLSQDNDVLAEAQRELEARLARITADRVAREEAAGATAALGGDTFHIWLDGFKTVVDATAPVMRPQQLLRGLPDGVVARSSDAHASLAPPTAAASSSASSSHVVAPPVLLLDCTVEFCRRQARAQLTAEVDAAQANTAAKLEALRRDCEQCRSRYRRAREADRRRQTTAAPVAAVTTATAAQPVVFDSIAKREGSEDGALDESLFRCGRKRRQRTEAVTSVAPSPPAVMTPSKPTHGDVASVAASPAAQMLHTELNTLRAQLDALSPQLLQLSRLQQCAHRTDWLTRHNVTPFSADHDNDLVADGCVLLLPHPETGLVRLQCGHHYRLVKFVGAHLVLAGQWEPIPLASADVVGPTAPSSTTVSARTAQQVKEEEEAQLWARRETAAVLLFLHEKPDCTAADFFALAAEEAAVYITAAAERGWYAP